MSQASLTEQTIGLQVEHFYEKAREDALLGPVFSSAIQDWPPHIVEITDFWCGALLGVRRYKGNPLAAHAKHPLTPAMFDRWLALWAATADDVFEPGDAAIVKDRAGLIGESLKSGLFFRPAKGP